MKKVVIIVLCLSLITLVAGCSISKGKETKTKVEKIEDKGNCKILDCINKIDVYDNLEKVNEIIGFDGEKLKDGDTYKWKLNEYESVEVTFYTNTNSIKINFNDNLIQSDKVDFSKYEEISKSLKNGDTITYDDVKKKFKDSGTLIEKSSSINKYRWVDSNGGYLNGNFNATTGRCSMIVGKI